MDKKLRSKSANLKLMLEEDFFMNNPPVKLKLQMRKYVKDYLERIDKDGTINTFNAEKKSHLTKIATILKEKKVGGWTDLESYHLNSGVFKMYKSLVDMVNVELKSKNVTQDSTNTGDAEGTPEKSEVP